VRGTGGVVTKAGRHTSELCSGGGRGRRGERLGAPSDEALLPLGQAIDHIGSCRLPKTCYTPVRRTLDFFLVLLSRTCTIVRPALVIGVDENSVVPTKDQGCAAQGGTCGTRTAIRADKKTLRRLVENSASCSSSQSEQILLGLQTPARQVLACARSLSSLCSCLLLSDCASLETRPTRPKSTV